MAAPMKTIFTNAVKKDQTVKPSDGDCIYLDGDMKGDFPLVIGERSGGESPDLLGDLGD